MTEYNPVIQVLVAPSRVKKGEMISIVASIHDKNTGHLMSFDNILMEIINEKGVPVWPLSTVQQNSATISKLISTSELEEGQKYTVRVTPSRYLRPIGTGEFTVEGVIPDFLIVPMKFLIPSMLLALSTDKLIDKVRAHGLQPLKIPKIKWLVFKTEHDSRVCKYCLANEGMRFEPDDPELPRIPVHPRCRCHYDIITVEEAEEIYEAYFRSLETVARIQEYHDAGMAALTVWDRDKQ